MLGVIFLTTLLCFYYVHWQFWQPEKIAIGPKWIQWIPWAKFFGIDTEKFVTWSQNEARNGDPNSRKLSESASSSHTLLTSTEMESKKSIISSLKIGKSFMSGNQIHHICQVESKSPKLICAVWRNGKVFSYFLNDRFIALEFCIFWRKVDSGESSVAGDMSEFQFSTLIMQELCQKHGKFWFLSLTIPFCCSN